MKKTYSLLAILIVVAVTILSTTGVNSHAVFPPAGACGDPTFTMPNPPIYAQYQTCAQSSCHGGLAQPITAQDLNIQIATDTASWSTLNNTFQYIPGQTYFVKFSVTVPAYAWGFQLTALNPDTTMAGSFATIGSTEHIIAATTTGGPSYIGHLHASHTVNSWTFNWTAPTTDSAVTFYYAFNASDSASFVVDQPDANIFADTVIIRASSAGVQNMANNISGLQIYPNPIDGAFSLSFNVLKAGNANASVYSVDGKFCRQLFNENLANGTFNRSYNIASLAAGIYLVKMNIGGASVTKKIVKE